MAKRLFAVFVVGILSVGCGGAAARTPTRTLSYWTPYIHLASPIDVVGPRRDGMVVVAANGRLWLLSRSGAVRPFAPAYHSNPGLEGYIALAGAGRRGCSFGTDTVYAISFGEPRGGGARTDAITRGTTTCAVRHVANGPAIAHAEGHIAILR